MTEADEPEQVLVWNGLVGTGGDDAATADGVVASPAGTGGAAARGFDEGDGSE